MYNYNRHVEGEDAPITPSYPSFPSRSNLPSAPAHYNAQLMTARQKPKDIPRTKEKHKPQEIPLAKAPPKTSQPSKVQKQSTADLSHHIKDLAAKVKRNPEQYQGLLATLRARKAELEAREAADAWKAARTRKVEDIARNDTKTKEERRTEKAELEAREAAEAWKAAKARKVEDMARNDTKTKEERRTEQERQEELARRAKPSGDFDRHVRFISDWLQVSQYPRAHNCPTDGHAVYVKKIKPRIIQIRQSALSKYANFAIRYVALMALIHILRLIYIHRRSKIGHQVKQCYEAEANANAADFRGGVDALSGYMLDILDQVTSEELRWLKRGQGAAGVLVQELDEVQEIVKGVASKTVQEGVGFVLCPWFDMR